MLCYKHILILNFFFYHNYSKFIYVIFFFLWKLPNRNRFVLDKVTINYIKHQTWIRNPPCTCDAMFTTRPGAFVLCTRVIFYFARRKNNVRVTFLWISFVPNKYIQTSFKIRSRSTLKIHRDRQRRFFYFGGFGGILRSSVTGYDVVIMFETILSFSILLKKPWHFLPSYVHSLQRGYVMLSECVHAIVSDR